MEAEFFFSALLCFALQRLLLVFVQVAHIYILVRGPKPQWYILQTQQPACFVLTLLPLLCFASVSVVKAVNDSSLNRLHLWLMLCRYTDK